MKKLTALALISITIFSCKQETKTVTKTDPKTGKSITVEVPADSVKTAAAPEPAIKDSLGIFTQKFKLEKGKTYPLLTVQKDVQTMTAPNGQSQSGTSETTDEMSFTVDNFDKGIYDITVNLIGKKISQKANGKSVTVDTKAAAPKEEQLKMVYAVNKALSGNTLKMKMDEKGKVISVTGFEPVYSKISSALSGIIKDAKQKTAFVNQFKQSFNEKAIKEQFTKNLLILPEKGAKIGEKWTKSESLSPDGKMKISTTFTLKSVENGVAAISVSGGLPYKSDKKSQNGITQSISMEMSQNGTVKLDQNTGWIQNQTMNMKTTQKQSLSDGKQSQSMTSVSNSTVTVNPSK